MLTIVLPPSEEGWDESTESFTPSEPELVLELEHSLLSLSKWESLYEKPFLSDDSRTKKELFDYVLCMCITPGISPEVIFRLTTDHFDQINDYIDRNHTATTFRETPGKRGRNQIITSELIYYWLVVYNIPFEVESWHLNRLLTLVRICNEKNKKPTRQSRAEDRQLRQELNAKRKAELGTSG